jgi:ribose-phosphate pyrophosphokinase
MLGAEAGKLVLGSFANSETRIEIHESVRNRHAFVVANISNPVNEGFMQTALLVQALKLADAGKVTVVLPYFPYSRQDRKADTRPPISARAVTDILKAMGAHQIVTVDLHATQVEGFFDGPFENLSGLSQLVRPLLREELGEIVVVSPDAGGAKRAEIFSRHIEKESGNFTPLVVMSKFRPGPGAAPQVTLSCGPEPLTGKTCVLVDDMIDTGGSIIAAANALKERGAARVIVCSSHAVFSNNACSKLQDARTADGRPAIDRIYVTDSLPVSKPAGEFLRIVSVAPLIAEAIARLDQPLGSLRELRDRTDLGSLLPEFDWANLKIN